VAVLGAVAAEVAVAAGRLFRRWFANYKPANHVELDQECLLHNVATITGLTGKKVIPVLKSNAYGHGIVEVASMLNDAPIDMVAVDGYFEANKIRRVIRHRILVMGYVDPENLWMLNTKKVSFVAQEIADVEAWGRLGKRVNLHVEINTGMNRMGIDMDELDGYLAALRKYPKLHLEGIMTHLADADNPDPSFTNGQVRLFDRAVSRVQKAGFKPEFIHIAQTPGSTKAKSKYANQIRLGIGTYGINPLSPGDRNYKKLETLRPVLTLKSRIVKVRELKRGDKVSYSLTFTAPKKMRIGVLPLGYYEGVPWALSNKGFVTYDGGVLPIVGRVCMNHTLIDITDTDLKLGDTVTAISKNKSDPNSIIALERDHGLFAYDTIVHVSDNIRRVVKKRALM
jgi:alanine racemase